MFSDLFLSENLFYENSFCLDPFPQVLALTGENGVGKTELLFRLAERIPEAVLLDLDNAEEKVLTPDKTKELVEFLRIITPGIEGFAFPYVLFGEEKIPLWNFGGGMIKLYVLGSVLLSGKGKLFLFENGESHLHYSLYSLFWHWIFQFIAQRDIQIVFTAYSNEFLHTFAEEGRKNGVLHLLRDGKDRLTGNYSYLDGEGIPIFF